MRSLLLESSKLSTTEFDSLHDFYNATNGPFWIWHNVSVQSTPWNFSIPGVNPCFDHWQGLVCSCGLKSCTVKTLFLDHHNLTGHLPNSMENFSKMSQLVLRGNNITGTITRSIGNMTELEVLDLSYNKLRGEIPSSIGRLLKLRSLNLGVNKLTKIPEELYRLRSLQGLSLFNNRIEGFISNKIGNLSSLETLQLQVNDFSPQPISTGICSLRSLKTLDLSHNSFIGPIPLCIYSLKNLTSWTMLSTNLSCSINEAIGNLTNLISLDLSRSNILGTIPSTIGNLTKLIILALNDNALIKYVPSSLGNLAHLRALFLQANILSGKVDFLAPLNATVFYLHQNSFTGTFIIPQNGLYRAGYFDISVNQLSGPLPWNSEWRILTIYEVYNNFFTGSLPSTEKLSFLRYYIAGNNYLMSTIPNDFLSQSSDIYNIDLGNNMLTGSIPESFGNFSRIGQISLSSNFLTGTLPDLQSNKLMVVLDLSFNQLQGSVPRSLSSLQYLEELFIQYNGFTGEMSSFLNGMMQRKLVNVDVSGNEFTGTVPESVFTECRRLESFAAASNCLQGSISEAICQSYTLLSLSLDGLTTSDDCKAALFPGLPYLNGFTVSHFIEGSIAPCLFEMWRLQLLHLSGNGLTGSIASDLNVTESLQDLSLSHNSLTGTIPAWIQMKKWKNLDLSYNKLSGTLRSDFSTPFANGMVSLEVNRLSGDLPSSLVTFNNTEMLSGNIFNCNLLQSNLPQSDSDASNYSCGSDNVNNVLYTWVGAFICVPLLLMMLMRMDVGSRSQKLFSLEELVGVVSKWKGWKAALREDENRVNLTRLSIYFSEVRQGTLRLTAYCMLILIPLYSVLKVYSSSYTIEYAWWISGMLMNGEAAAIVLFVALILFAVLYVRTLKGIVMKVNVRMPKERRKKEPSKEDGRGEGCGETMVVYSLIIITNVVVMALADFSYVYVVISFDSLAVTFAALGLALFRLMTNHLILWWAIPCTSSLLGRVKRWIRWSRDSKCEGGGRTKSSGELEYSARDISFLENLTLFNNIIIPGLAIVLILPDCFYNALFAAEDVQSSYYYNSCYQYAPRSGVTHICETYEAFVDYSPPYIYSYQCSSKIVINYVPVYVLMFILAGIVIPSVKVGLKVLYDYLREHDSERSKRMLRVVELVVPQYFKELRSDLAEPLRETGSSLHSSLQDSSVAARTMFVGEEEKRKHRLFSKLTMTVQINSYLTILMCFGALFPPLALIAAMSIYSITYFEELWIGWVLTETRGLGLGYGWYEEQIERECEGVEESSNLTIWSTLVVSCCLYGYVIFDTMGDSVGWAGALPMTLMMMLMPLVCYGGLRLHREWVRRRRARGSGLMDEEGRGGGDGKVEGEGGAVGDLDVRSVEEGKEVIREGSSVGMRGTEGSVLSLGGARTMSTIELAPRLTDRMISKDSTIVTNPLFSSPES